MLKGLQVPLFPFPYSAFNLKEKCSDVNQGLNLLMDTWLDKFTIGEEGNFSRRYVEIKVLFPSGSLPLFLPFFMYLDRILKIEEHHFCGEPN